jgi:uncharacterized RDD family membrane protein YckC
MDIWIIQDGAKQGPIHDFEVRRRIESGELAADTPAWHEGLDGWRPLVEISLFSREFDRLEEHRNVAGEAPGTLPMPADTRDGPHLGRRFWARWFDLYLFSGVWWMVIWAAGRDVGGILQNPWIILFHYVPWFVLEAVLLQRFGTTPGKWLLGIRVINDKGTLLSLAESTRRAARVLFLGIGFGWGYLVLICQVMAFFTARRIGRPLWDHAGGHHLETTPLHPLRLVVYVFGLFTALSMQFFVVFPYVLEAAAKKDPAIKEQWEKIKEGFSGKSGPSETNPAEPKPNKTIELPDA